MGGESLSHTLPAQHLLPLTNSFSHLAPCCGLVTCAAQLHNCQACVFLLLLDHFAISRRETACTLSSTLFLLLACRCKWVHPLSITLVAV